MFGVQCWGMHRLEKCILTFCGVWLLAEDSILKEHCLGRSKSSWMATTTASQAPVHKRVPQSPLPVEPPQQSAMIMNIRTPTANTEKEVVDWTNPPLKGQSCVYLSF